MSYTFRAVANRWLEVLKPTKMHIQRIVQKLERNQVVPLVEVNINRRRTTDGKINAFGHVRVIQQGGLQKWEAKLFGYNDAKGKKIKKQYMYSNSRKYAYAQIICVVRGISLPMKSMVTLPSLRRPVGWPKKVMP
jgi:hypothetical protein